MKKIQYLVFPLFLLLILTNCFNKKDDVLPEYKLNPVDSIDVNEYQVYSLILKENFKSSKELVIKQKTVVLIASSMINGYQESIKKDNPDLDATLFSDFTEKNDSSFNLGTQLTVPSKTITLITSEEVAHFFTPTDVNQGWNDFYKKHPNSNGMIDLTRVGFNKDKDQAIVAVGHYYASLGAEGLLIYLVKKNNSWRIVQTINTWTS